MNGAVETGVRAAAQMLKAMHVTPAPTAIE